MIGMSFALRGGERRACVKWRVKWWLERAREVEAWRIRGKSPVGANTRKACLLDGMFKRGEESAGVAERSCPSGQTHKVRLAAKCFKWAKGSSGVG